jgi:hypothetical protein
VDEDRIGHLQPTAKDKRTAIAVLPPQSNPKHTVSQLKIGYAFFN